MFNFRILRAILAVVLLPASLTLLPALQEPKLSEEQIRGFLLNAKVIASRRASKGITSPYRLTMTDGTITHDAGFQPVNEAADQMELTDGRIELNFRDCYKYDIAAYELAKLLGLGEMMPVYVERKWNGMTGAISWWLPVMMDEASRVAKKIEPPDMDAWNRQANKRLIFVELVCDADANRTNVIISEDWRLWMIDFTRAFRLSKELRNRSNITDTMCERHLLERMRRLDRDELALKTKGLLTKSEIDGVMARRDKIVAIYDDLIAKKGEKAVLYDDLVVK
jgi:hypothetical protein